MAAGSSADAWAEFSDNWRDLARRLGDRYRDLGQEKAAGAPAEEGPGKEGPAEAATADRDKLNEAMRTLSDQLNRAFTSLGEAVRDEETQATLERVASSFGKAMAATFADVGQEIQRAAEAAAAERRRRRAERGRDSGGAPPSE